MEFLLRRIRTSLIMRGGAGVLLFISGVVLASCSGRLPEETDLESLIHGENSSPSVIVDDTVEIPVEEFLDIRVPQEEGEPQQPSSDPSFDAPDPMTWERPEAVDLDWRPPLYQPPLALRPEDHFYFTRPIPSGAVNWSHPFYRYGNTHFGESSIHTGVDMGAELGTPVLAAGRGEVIWVGFGLYRGSYDKEDPYGLAVAVRHDFGHLSQILFTVYGHLESTTVWPGQRVEMGDVIGAVGNTGHSTGPHLHFEVRLGENRYFGTRNPELWMVPPEGWGVLAGRVLDTPGRTLKEYLVRIRSIETDKECSVWTYAEGTVFGDELYRENFANSDLPAGPYEVMIDYLGVRHTAQIYVYSGMTSFFVFNGRNGFTIEPELENRSFSPFEIQ